MMSDDDLKKMACQHTGGEAEQHGVAQKESDPSHVVNLFDACWAGDMDEVRRLLDLGQVDLNCRGMESMTLLMAAAQEGHRGVVEFLVCRGADVSLVDSRGNNILHWACVGGDVGTVELPLSMMNVVDVSVKNNRGMTAADVARHYGHHQLLDLLKSHGVY